MKSLNLKNNRRPVKFILLLCLAVTCGNKLAAQSETKITVGAGLGPIITMALNTTSSTAPLPAPATQTFKKYVDSVKAKETWRLSWQFNVWFNYFISKNLDLQSGISYIDIGYQRQQTDLGYKNATYPGIGTGKIEDLSNSKKDIYYNYRYQYLQIPVLINYRFKRTRDLLFTFAVSGGIAANVLLKHQLQAELVNGFTINGEKEFKIDSTGYSAAPFALNLLGGGRVEYKYEKRLHIVFQPMIGFYPLSVSTGTISSYPLYFAGNIGIYYDLK